MHYNKLPEFCSEMNVTRIRAKRKNGDLYAYVNQAQKKDEAGKQINPAESLIKLVRTNPVSVLDLELMIGVHNSDENICTQRVFFPEYESPISEPTTQSAGDKLKDKFEDKLYSLIENLLPTLVTAISTPLIMKSAQHTPQQQQPINGNTTHTNGTEKDQLLQDLGKYINTEDLSLLVDSVKNRPDLIKLALNFLKG